MEISRMDNIVTDLQLIAYEARNLKRDKYELLETLKQIILTCPCDPDTTDAFLKANQRAAALIQKSKSCPNPTESWNII